MFRELVSYAITSINLSGHCSLQLHTTDRHTSVIVTFCTGNLLNRLTLCSYPSNLLIAKKALEVVSSFLAVSSTVPKIYSLLGFEARVSKALFAELHQAPEICIVPVFSHEELYKTLAGPTIRILDRYDFHSVLQFMLMKFRSVLDSDWLANLPELRKVIFIFVNVVWQCFCLGHFTSFSFLSIYFAQSCSYAVF